LRSFWTFDRRRAQPQRLKLTEHRVSVQRRSASFSFFDQTIELTGFKLA